MTAYQRHLAAPLAPLPSRGWGLRVGLATAAVWTAVLAFCPWEAMGQTEDADKARIERGKYLVTLGGCGDCHTPGYFLGEQDDKRALGGSEVGFEPLHSQS